MMPICLKAIINYFNLCNALCYLFQMQVTLLYFIRKNRIAKIDSKDSNFIRGHWKSDDANQGVRVKYPPYWDILEQGRNLPDTSILDGLL